MLYKLLKVIWNLMYLHILNEIASMDTGKR